MDRYDCARILSLQFNTITQYKFTAYSHDTHYTTTISRNSWIKIGAVGGAVGGAAVAIVGGAGVAVVGGDPKFVVSLLLNHSQISL